MVKRLILLAALVIPLAAQARPGDGKLAGFFSPEQRAVFIMQAHDQVKDMAPDERKTFRKDQIARLMAMSDSEREQLKASLQAKWEALPQTRKDKIERRIASRQAKEFDAR